MDEQQVEEIIRRTVEATAKFKEAEHARVEKVVEKMHDTLYGNGREGLTTTVDRLERAVGAAQKVFNQVVTVLVIALVIGLLILVVQAGLLKP